VRVKLVGPSPYPLISVGLTVIPTPLDGFEEFTVRVYAVVPEVVKFAVTAVVAAIVTLHESVPLQAPPHPLKIQPDAGAAFKLTLVPLL
jgi:hypothetical protein